MIRRTMLIASALLFGAAVAPRVARAADCTLVSVNKGKTDLVVYFTKFREEDKTGGRYKACRIVSKKRPGSKTFRVTPFRQDASVIVHRSNWP